MKKQDARKRVKNFNEVALGLTEAEAVKEAERCLACKKALCINGCPVEINIPEFITLIKDKKFKEAISEIKKKNSLPAVCGRVCPQETQCEEACVLAKKGKGIKIGYLERFVADWELSQLSLRGAAGAEAIPTTRNIEIASGASCPRNDGKKVAVIGSGPAGLTCAADLAKLGYNVTIFESLHKPGGVLVYGIPEFRLPKQIVNIEIDYIKNLGVELKLNMVIGKTFSLDELKKDGYKAFFIGTGAGLPYFLGIEGENLVGVYSANEFLTRTNLMKAYLFPEYDTPIKIADRVAVIGGGNVAMDSARCAKRLGAKEVICVYRRTEKEMPARVEEIENAKEEDIKFEFLTSPIQIIADNKGWVKEMRCIRNKLGEPDTSGRRRPVPIKDSEFNIKVDTIVCAIGQGPNPLLPSATQDLKLTKRGYIEADKKTSTSISGVFAGGDITGGEATVIKAMGAGKIAARSINEYLRVHSS